MRQTAARSILAYFHQFLDIPKLFNFIRHILDGGQIKEIAGILETIPHQKVIDIACGTGDISRAVHKEYVGIDICPSFIEYANKEYGSGNKKFFVMDATKLEFPRKFFDLALIVNAIHHLTAEEVQTMLTQAAELSKKYVLVIDVIPSSNLIRKFFLALDRGEYFRHLNDQKALIENSKRIKLVREDSFYSTSRIYHHSVLLGEVIN